MCGPILIPSTVMVTPVRQTVCPGSARMRFMSGTPRVRFTPPEATSGDLHGHGTKGCGHRAPCRNWNGVAKMNPRSANCKPRAGPILARRAGYSPPALEDVHTSRPTARLVTPPSLTVAGRILL